eukprot:CAMPEP_0113658434 /NCGR_PEP_ID=MMETSP0017_2-20120614/31715_1 /TAXON_ID=2856 /ORGANISM="Cylindrotheca closterium" /LENGTH=659 /DNA_ID=CAMNT_0000572703 /DNA_START=80 /DNA_END=2055 /DNA_ORIENTATION=- /assembly_acc=CAM_ASM_000147
MTAERNPKPLTVDIRVFMLITVSAMAIAFGVGVAMGPTAAELAMASAGAAAGHKLPEVHSVDVSTAEDAAALKEDSELLHEPAGQHLLVDIKGIEASSHAMVETVKGAGLTMLSYHCHKLIPMGVSCVGVLLESHISFHTWPTEGVITLDLFTCGPNPLIPVISFHTWPTEGVITLDLFTCGPNPLIPVVPSIKALFGIPRENDEIMAQWSHELRGFRSKKIPNKDNHNYALLDHNSDLSQMIWSPMDCVYKEQVYSGLTEYQRVDVWDVVSLEDQPSQDDVLKAKLEPTDSRWTTNELVQPTRYLFLDGVLQSDNTTHKEYHEALVHPAMFAHASPKNVAIVGGAEGATLREVLKHTTVESVTMVEIDQQLMDLAKEYLPQMSDCSNLDGRADNCFDDELLNLQVENAKDWFLADEAETNKNLDVVIIDAIEPEMSSAISKDLYEEPQLWKTILDSLTEEGILAIQIGYAPTISDPKPDVGYNAPREILFQTLENLPSVQAMFVYEDSHVGFLVPKSFLIVCKSNSCRERFYAAPEDLNMEIAKRIVSSSDNNNKALQYYDGVTQIYYQVAPKAWETIYCRREPTPFECDYRHLDFGKGIYEFKMDAPAEEQVFEIMTDEVEGTRVYSKVDIPKGSYIMAEHAANSLQLSSKAVENLS